jgi:hypothetical protein
VIGCFFFARCRWCFFSSSCNSLCEREKALQTTASNLSNSGFSVALDIVISDSVASSASL